MDYSCHRIHDQYVTRHDVTNQTKLYRQKLNVQSSLCRSIQIDYINGIKNILCQFSILPFDIVIISELEVFNMLD